MKDWYIALLEPWRVAPHPNETARRLTSRAAFSMLIEGRLYDYNQYRASESIASRSKSGEDALESRFVEAFFNHLAGDERSGELHRIAVDASARLDLRLAAGIVTSIAFAEAGRLADARDLLEGLAAEVKQHDDSDGAAIAHLHLGMRLAELGQWHQAIEATTLARTFVRGRTAAHRALTILMDSNLWNYRIRTDDDPGRLPGLEKRPLPHLLLRGAQLRSPALRAELKSSFDRLFDDPSSRRFHWSAVDEVDNGLWASLMRDEVTAHFGGVRRSRAMYGYYRLATGTGIADSELRDGLALLIRADEVQDTRAAARFFVKAGPLASLVGALHWLLSFDRSWLTARSSYSLVEAAGELLDSSTAISLANEFLNVAATTKSATPERRVWDMLGHEPLEALASIIPVLKEDEHELVARRLLDLIDDEANFVFGDAVQRCVPRLSWPSLDSGTRLNWILRASQWIEARDLRRLGTGVLVNLAATGEEDARVRLLDTFHRHPTLGAAAALLDAQVQLDHGAAQLIADVAVRAVTERQNKAAAGEHSWGSVDAALLLTLIQASLSEADQHWPLLIDFLVDPHISQDEKERTFTHLATHVREIPEAARRKLVANTRNLQVPGRSFWGGDAPALAAQYALLSGVGGIPADDLLGDFLSWSQSADAALRLEAARLAQLTSEMLPSNVLATTALALTHDHHVDIAGAAARALIALLGQLQAPLRHAASKRLRELLHADGVVLPGSVLAALRDHSADRSEFAADVGPLENHPSVHIRRLALDYLDGAESTLL